MLYLSPVLAVVLMLIAGSGVFAIFHVSPLEGLHTYFILPISTQYGLAELTVKATPLILIAIGLSLGFRANVWNIGAEGQLIMGGVVGGGIALWFYDSESSWLLPAMIVGGVLGGMAWAAIPALLKTRLNVNEILTSLMLTYVAALLLTYLIDGPWKDPEGFSFPQSRSFPPAALLPILLDETRLHLGWPIALAVVAAGWLVMSRSVVGFQIRVLGLAPHAARYAGFSRNRIVWLTMLAGGGLAGLSGLIEISGPIGQLLPVISPGYGFTAIIVAFLGRLNPIGILFAGLLVALSYLGGEQAQISLNLPIAVTGVFQGMLLFFLLGCDVLIGYRVRFGRPRRDLAKAAA